MCGICGIVGERDRPDRSEILRAMTRTLHHRGPDDEGYLEAPSRDAAFGFRRLSIIDLAGGHQPMTNEDGRVMLVFNGEIYNFRELRSRLEKQGHRFASKSDAEVVVHLYEERGPDLLHDLEGMFAFAIWDDRDHSLLLARDRTGKKPLVYRQDGDRLLFGSEIKALLRHPDVPRDFDPASLPGYLSLLYVPPPLTAFRGIRKLPPGHRLRFQSGRIQIDRYWEPRVEPQETMTEEEAGDRIYTTLSRAVEKRLMSDVPLGAFLSGGIDSTIVVGLMSHHLGEPVKTFSIGFGEAGYDERDHAREAAGAFRTDHHEFLVRPSAVEVLPKLVAHYDEPFADSSAVPTYYVSKYTAEHVKVALSGDGGDECFGGYRRYAAIERLAKWKTLPGATVPIFKAAGGMLGLVPFLRGSTARTREKIRRLLRILDRPLSELYLEMVSFYQFGNQSRILQNGHGDGHGDGGAFIRDPFDRFAVDPITAATYTDLMTYLPNDILTKVDIASMACSLEVRCPFLDREVIDLSFRMPGRFKVSGSSMKIALKRAFRGLIPPGIQRRGKLGFGIPVGEWFRGELRPMLEDVVLSRRFFDRGLFREEEVRRVAQEHLSGAFDNGHPLWILLCLELWFETFVDRVPSSA